MTSVEFYVREVRRMPSGECLVIGVPNNGAALAVGDRFAVTYAIGRDDVMSGTSHPSRLNSVAVELEVETIDVMHSEVSRVPHGVTAALSLVGAGLEHVKVGCFLRTKDVQGGPP